MHSSFYKQVPKLVPRHKLFMNMNVISMKQKRYGASSFVYQQQMFAAGGGSGSMLDSLERLNIDEKPGQWLHCDAKLPVKLYAQTNVVYQNRLIGTGGYNVNGVSDGIYENFIDAIDTTIFTAL